MFTPPPPPTHTHAYCICQSAYLHNVQLYYLNSCLKSYLCCSGWQEGLKQAFVIFATISSLGELWLKESVFECDCSQTTTFAKHTVCFFKYTKTSIHPSYVHHCHTSTIHFYGPHTSSIQTMYNYIICIVPLSLYHVSSSEFLVLSHNTPRMVEGKNSKRHCCRLKHCHDLVYNKLMGKTLTPTLTDGTCSWETVTVTGSMWGIRCT